METRPSFSTLFGRSRYTRNDITEKVVTRKSQQELFAVAAVAFLLEHDRNFLPTFLEKICGVTGADLKRKFTVELQPDDHADLRLACAEIGAVYIVEFKLRANLDSKQDPTQYDDFMQPGSGYGAVILSQYANCRQRIYVVLQDWPTFEESDVHGIPARDLIVHSRRWSDLIDSERPESSLTRDLLDTLGGWGVTALQFRHKPPMKKADHTQDTIAMFQIITDVAAGIGSKPSKFDWDVEPGDDGEGGWFGRNFPFGLKSYTRLEKFAESAEESLGWFGYSPSEEGATLDVWVYCKPSKAAKTPMARTLEFVQKRLGTNFGGTIVAEQNCVRVSVRGDAVADDWQRYAHVFDALRDSAA